jgi:transcriptional regulator with XRE-family HTH domain
MLRSGPQGGRPVENWKETEIMNTKTKTRMNEPSQDVILYLRKQGKTLAQIGKMLGVGESYISRVAAGSRSLTLRHLERMAGKMKMTLPELFLTATPIESVPKKFRKLYTGYLDVLRLSDRLRVSLERAGSGSV